VRKGKFWCELRREKKIKKNQPKHPHLGRVVGEKNLPERVTHTTTGKLKEMENFLKDWEDTQITRGVSWNKRKKSRGEREPRPQDIESC